MIKYSAEIGTYDMPIRIAIIMKYLKGNQEKERIGFTDGALAKVKAGQVIEHQAMQT
jgi:hypothetical protein